MGNSIPLAPAWAARRPAMFERKAEKHLRRFHRRYRGQVEAMARSHPALMDLAFSFPALLFVLSVPHTGVDATPLRQLAIAGVPLKALAKQANLPLWTRKLPPEAFGQPLLWLPRQPAFARQIGNHLVPRARHAARWLENVMLACELGDEAFAVWIAREFPAERIYPRFMRRMALWAWFSLRPEHAAHQFAIKPWRPEMSRLAARRAMSDWLDRLKLHVTIADAVLEPLWIEAGQVDGLDFVPLLSANAIHAEAEAMQNCLRGYGTDLATNAQRLWSLRKGGRRVATLSVGCHHDLGLLCITEIKGPGNEKVPRAVAIAAQRWIDRVDVTAIDIQVSDWQAFIPNPKAWAALFKPYWMEKRRIFPWLPLAPTVGDLKML